MTEDGRLGYLAMKTSSDDQAFAGGLLITNSEHRPLDFRCTEAIRPSPIQRLLYGEVFHQHLYVDLFGLTLVRAADPQPHLVLFQQPEFLYLQRRLDKMPALWVTGENEAAGARPDQTRPPVDTQHLTITDRSGGTVGIFVYRGYGERVDAAKPLLESVAPHYELLEPFRRVATLLEEVLQPARSSDATP